MTKVSKSVLNPKQSTLYGQVTQKPPKKLFPIEKSDRDSVWMSLDKPLNVPINVRCRRITTLLKLDQMSIKQLSYETGLSERQVEVELRYLEKKRLVKKVS